MRAPNVHRCTGATVIICLLLCLRRGGGFLLLRFLLRLEGELGVPRGPKAQLVLGQARRQGLPPLKGRVPLLLRHLHPCPEARGQQVAATRRGLARLIWDPRTRVRSCRRGDAAAAKHR